jgi:biopolymer transport protein ExbD
MKLAMLLFFISFMLGCTDQDAFFIRVEQDGVFVGNKKVANVADVAKQDSFLVEALHKELESKKDTSQNCQIKIDPEQSLNVFYKVATTCYVSGYTNTSIMYRINEEDYIQPFSLNDIYYIRCDPYYPYPNFDECLHLAVRINGAYLEVWKGGGTLPEIFYKENPDSAYDELTNQLNYILGFYKDPPHPPDRDVGMIIGQDNIEISNIIPVMHRLRTAGFTEISLQIYNKQTEFNSVGFWNKGFRYHLERR